MFEIKGLNVGYGKVQVLWDVSLRVEQGEIVTVLGPNGAGKSTLLQTALGLLKPMKTGETDLITYRNQRIDGLPPEEIVRLGIALITEEKNLFPDMTVLDNLKMGSYIKRAKIERTESLDLVFKLFPRLAERKNQMANTLSGGERQMVAIGRALMSKPDLLMVDEPSIGLQPLLIAKIFDTIREINGRGVTILLVEQNVFFSLEISNRAYVLENGRVVMEGKGKDLLDNPHVKKAYLAI
ncbi:MAG: branched-chain amino acid ABC transporter ATP-binding protein [Deltaproteobacteria bacterium RBG_13_51_10]|jgi:branched-chain amino acid transport system ATP-binding protein|nr:MAG: branched-chain amino acid ABC transporter ATP-binding protein [Deltaproteobacteria bacterium RBG_13_51_10]